MAMINEALNNLEIENSKYVVHHKKLLFLCRVPSTVIL